MKRTSLIVIACLLLAVVGSFTACIGGQEQEQYEQDRYYYYINLVNQYNAAYAAELQQAEQYFSLARELQKSELNIEQQEYERLINLGKTHQENATKYYEMAEQSRNLATQHQ